MKTVVIYRHQLFQPSEGFIFSQTKYLKQFKPVFSGRTAKSPPAENLIIKTIPNKLDRIKHMLFRDCRSLKEQLEKLKPELIHAHFGVEGVYALPLARQLDIPLITTFHGFDATTTNKALLTSGKVSWLNYLLQRKQLTKECDQIICVSNFIKHKLLKLGFPENKLITHSIGIDTEQIQPIDIEKKEQIILHVARLVEKKGTKNLIQAFKTIKVKHPDAKLIIIGDGPLKQQLQYQASNLQLSKDIQFLGVQNPETVIKMMQKATLFCLPSIQAHSGDAEGLGMVFLEAAACGIPSVATRHGGIPEAVLDEQTGFLVEENNPNQLADRLCYLLEHESQRKNMGIAARHFVTEHFNLKNQTAQLEQIYLDTLLL